MNYRFSPGGAGEEPAVVFGMLPYTFVNGFFRIWTAKLLNNGQTTHTFPTGMHSAITMKLRDTTLDCQNCWRKAG